MADAFRVRGDRPRVSGWPERLFMLEPSLDSRRLLGPPYAAQYPSSGGLIPASSIFVARIGGSSHAQFCCIVGVASPWTMFDIRTCSLPSSKWLSLLDHHTHHQQPSQLINLDTQQPPTQIVKMKSFFAALSLVAALASAGPVAIEKSSSKSPLTVRLVRDGNTGVKARFCNSGNVRLKLFTPGTILDEAPVEKVAVYKGGEFLARFRCANLEAKT